MLIHLLEDEESLSEILKEKLTQLGYEIIHSPSLKTALKNLNHSFNAHILDLFLPDGSGLTFAEELRRRGKAEPILFLTAAYDPKIRVPALELEPCDFMLKPFEFLELQKRLQKFFPRNQKIFQLGCAQVNFEEHWIRRDHEEHRLTEKESKILELLWSQSPKTVSREWILSTIWGEESEEHPTTRTIDNFVSRLRKWIEWDSQNPQYLISIRGIGYQLQNIKKEFK